MCGGGASTDLIIRIDQNNTHGSEIPIEEE